MKGLGPAYDSGWFIMEVILVLFLLGMTFSTVSAFMNPDKQIVLLNTMNLRSKINEACLTGGPVTLQGFEFPQPKPMTLLGLSDEFVRFAIRAGGDPHYVLYYEAFPYGEGVGWELYQDLGNRVMAPYKYVDPATGQEPAIGATIPVTDFENQMLFDDDSFLKKVNTEVSERFRRPPFRSENEEIMDISRISLVSNIVLHEKLGAIPGGIETAEGPVLWIGGTTQNGDTSRSIESMLDLQSLGEWETDNYFAFANYRGLSQLEQSFIKYRPCGDNTLCLKTREGVHKFPLDDSCSDIKYMQLVFDSRYDSTTTGLMVLYVGVEVFFTRGMITKTVVKGLTLGGKVLSFFSKFVPGLGTLSVIASGAVIREVATAVAGYFLNFKMTDFYVASPCSIEGDLTIEKTDCISYPGEFDRTCDRMMVYPIYEYNEQGTGVTKIGEHHTCVEGIGDEFGEINILKDSDQLGGNLRIPKNSDECIRITLREKPDSFCWTPNAYNEEDNFFAEIFGEFGTQQAAKITGAFAIKSNTDFIAVPDAPGGVLIKAIVNPERWKGMLKRIFDIDWRWPSGFLVPG